MPPLGDTVDALRATLGFNSAKSGDSSGQYLPRTGEAPADSEIVEYETRALESLNAATLDATPSAVSGGLPMTNMTAAGDALQRLSETLTSHATGFDRTLRSTDEQLAAKLRAGKGGDVIDQIGALSGTAGALAGPVQSAGDARNGIAAKLSELAADAAAKVEAYTSGGECRSAPVFSFDWSSGGDFIALGDRLATDIIPELHNITNPDDPIRGVTNMIPLLSEPSTTTKASGLGELSTGEARSIAERFIETGLPYSWGGGHTEAPGPSLGTGDNGGDADKYGDAEKIGLDCSGLSRSYIFDAYGVDIGAGTTHDQYASLTAVDAHGRRPGDLYFPPDGNGGVNLEHVQVYLGDDTVLESKESGTQLTLSPMEEGGDYRRYAD